MSKLQKELLFVVLLCDNEKKIANIEGVDSTFRLTRDKLQSLEKIRSSRSLSLRST